MKTRRSLFRAVAVTLFSVTAGASVLAFADGPAQPDPPVTDSRAVNLPAGSLRVARATRGALDREPECRCAVLHVRDIESRVDGHVEAWQALARGKAADVRVREPAGFLPLRLTTFVEGVVGFPVRQYRLAADADGDVDDGAGAD